MTAIGAALIVVGVSLILVAFWRRWGTTAGYVEWTYDELTGAETRRVMSAVRAGEVPEDERLATAARRLAGIAIHNYPIALGMLRFSVPGLLAAAAGLGVFVPALGASTFLTVLVMGSWSASRLVRQRRGAEQILSR